MTLLTEIQEALYKNLYDPFPDIPGNLEWPFIGSTFQFARDVHHSILDNYRKYGDIFKIRALGDNYIFMIGPEANKMVLQDQQLNFLSAESWGKILGELFHGAIMLTDGEEHSRYRRIMQTAFHKEPMSNYLLTIEQEVDTYLNKEIPINNHQLIVYPAMVRLTMKIAGKLFFGVHFKEEQLEWIVDVTMASMAPIRYEIPYTPYWKGMQARKNLTTFYKDIIREKRRKPGDDMFSQMCIARSDSGEIFTDAEIIDQMIFLMMASHDTTTSTLTSVIYETAKSPEWQERMLNESNTFYNIDPLEYGRLKEFRKIGWVIQEALRLHPPLVVLPRNAVRDFEFKGYRIPAGTKIALPIYVTHTLPEIYTDPLKFDPERFSDERAEHKKKPICYLPFGAGKHICIGQYFAEMEAKIILSKMVQRFHWSVPKGYKMQQAPPLNHPKDGLPVRIDRRR
jgi:cytochrome P450